MLPRVQLQRGLRFLLNYPHFIEHFPKSCKPPSEYSIALFFTGLCGAVGGRGVMGK